MIDQLANSREAKLTNVVTPVDTWNIERKKSQEKLSSAIDTSIEAEGTLCYKGAIRCHGLGCAVSFSLDTV